MYFTTAAFLCTLIMGIAVVTNFTGMSSFFILHRFPKRNRRIVTDHINVIMNESTIYMYNLLLSYSFHCSLRAIAHHTLGFLEVVPATPFAQEFADPVRNNGESGLKVITALVNIDMATAAHQNIKSLL